MPGKRQCRLYCRTNNMVLPQFISLYIVIKTETTRWSIKIPLEFQIKIILTTLSSSHWGHRFSMIKFFLGFRSLESLSVTWKTQCFEFISSPCSWFHGNYHALTSQVLGVHSKEINTNSCVNSRSFQTLQELRKSCWIKREQTQE
jgi:hypothetical protein